MERIITHPSSIRQWQLLVNEAAKACNCTLNEELESYLVFLLMRFTSSPNITQKVFGLEFIVANRTFGAQRPIVLRDLGDQCLLYTGLFPARARRRRVRVSYYVNLGKSAYNSLSQEQHSSYNTLFANLAEQFIALMDILHTMREVNTQTLMLDPILAEEIWHDTGSQHALQTLQQFTTSNTAPICSIDLSKSKH